MAYLYDLTDTWNAAGTVFNAIKMNVTNTASAAGSKIVSLQVGATDRFTVDKDGNGYFSGTLQAVGSISSPNAYISGNSGTIGMQDNTASILAYNGTGSGGITNTLRFITGAAERVRIDGNGNVGIGTSSPTAIWGTTVQVGNGTGNGTFSIVGSGGSGFMAMAGSNFQLIARGSTPLQLGSNDVVQATLDTSGNLGLGTTSPSQRLDATVSSGTEGAGLAVTNSLAGGYGSGVNFYSFRSDGITKLTAGAVRMVGAANWADAANTSSSMTFHTVNANTLAERMRIDGSGNVGIGTATPSGALNIVDQNNTIFYLDEYSNADGAIIRARRYRGTIASPSAVQTGDAITALRGFGYTSAGSMGSLSASIDFYAAENFTSTAQGAFIAFRTNPAGSAGAAAERMRIDASGNLLLNTTAAVQPLTIGSSSASSAGINQRTTTTDFSIVPSNSAAGGVTITAGWVSGGQGPLIFSQSAGERMRLDSSGNLGIGVTSMTDKLSVAGSALFSGTVQCPVIVTGNGISTGDVQIELGGNRSGSGNSYIDWHSTAGADFESRIIRYAGTNGGLDIINTGTGGTVLSNSGAAPIVFQTNNTERARIDSSGNLLVGTTSAGLVDSHNYNYTVGSGRGYYNHVNGTGSGADYLIFGYNATQIGSITQNGTTGVLYNTSSDARLKHDIVDAPEASSLIDAIKVRSFKWNANNSDQRYGFIAQELLEVAPEAVSVPADEEAMMGVDYSKLVPMLVKEIQSLRARVAQLEGN